ncbi:MAG: 16S rRNA (cytosine(967)-C(5))-methyltransferase RsmB [Acidobacteriota bacterium]
MKISPARRSAFEILLRIERDKSFSSILLPEFEKDLSPKDRALCHQLTFGVLRRRMLLDRMISALVATEKLDLEVLMALRIGLFQLRFLDRIPPFSAINESVELVKFGRKTSAKGLVNAVLRRLSKENAPPEFGDDTDRLAVETSHPHWFVEKWKRDFGDNASEMLRSNNLQAPAAFRVLPDDAIPDPNFAANYPKSEFVDECLFASTSDISALTASDKVYFQDEGSQLVAQAVFTAETETFLDVCAAPGGKTTMIAGHMMSGLDLFVAGDRYWPRVQSLQQNCRRQNSAFVNILQYDAAEAIPIANHSIDVVLVDTPCTGTGTIRRNPEIRYFIEPETFASINIKQRQILVNASKVVKPGGRLIYSSCSLEKEENEDICNGFLREHADFMFLRPRVPERFITSDGFARTFPYRDGMDGFFLAEFRHG